MSIAFVFGSALQGMYEFAIFGFMTVALSVFFSLVFFALFLVVLGPEIKAGEAFRKLRPAVINHILRKYQHVSKSSLIEIGKTSRASFMVANPFHHQEPQAEPTHGHVAEQMV